MKKSAKERWQSVEITLSDGRVIIYTGREQVKGPVEITKIVISIGEDMPENYHFEELKVSTQR
jgi:hypothetical protein